MGEHRREDGEPFPDDLPRILVCKLVEEGDGKEGPWGPRQGLVPFL